MNIRKWPLFHGALPFLAGLLCSYYCSLPVYVVACVAVPVLIATFFVYAGSPEVRKRDKWRMSVAYTVFFVLGFLLFSAHDFRLKKDSIARFEDQELMLSGTVLEAKSGIGGRQQLLVEVTARFEGDSIAPCSGRIVAFLKDDAFVFTHGDVILLSAQLHPVRNAGNPGEFDAESFYRSRRVSGFVFTTALAVEKIGYQRSLNTVLADWRHFLATKMEEHLDGTFLAIAKALVLGDKSDLDDETMYVFSSTGSMHVLAVSGLHIGLILLLLQKVLLVFSRWISKKQAILIAIALIWIYGGITGASPAVMRAVVMFTILSGSQLFGRPYQGVNGLGLSLFLLLAFDPWMLFDLGFQLSYLAMLGIFLLYRPLAATWTPNHKWARAAWDGTAVGCAATILTTPVVLQWFYQFPNYFALANLGVMLFGFLVLVGGMIFLASVWIPFVVKLTAVLFAFMVIGLVAWVSWVDSLPGAVSGGFHLAWWEVALAYALIALWILHLHTKKGKRWWFVAGGLGLIAAWTMQRHEVLKSNEWVVFNSNQFITVIKKGDELIGVYDAKWNGSWLVPKELKSYARYSGCHLIVHPLYRDQLQVVIGAETWEFRKEKEGIGIERNKQRWFFRTNGLPDLTENPQLMATRIQLQLHPDQRPKPFVQRF